MAVTTKNAYGKISITDEAIAIVTGHAAMECYGIVSLVPKKLLGGSLKDIPTKHITKGIKINTAEDKIFIDLYVVVKYGVSINAVAQALKENVKYAVEKFTGMVVDTININVIGVKL